MSNLEMGLPAYDYAWKLSRSRWAWEFLRRNPDFLSDASRHGEDELSVREACRNITIIRPRTDQCDAERWGLAFFPIPHSMASMQMSSGRPASIQDRFRSRSDRAPQAKSATFMRKRAASAAFSI